MAPAGALLLKHRGPHGGDRRGEQQKNSALARWTAKVNRVTTAGLEPATS
jgi:hypothetical protein